MPLPVNFLLILGHAKLHIFTLMFLVARLINVQLIIAYDRGGVFHSDKKTKTKHFRVSGGMSLREHNRMIKHLHRVSVDHRVVACR